MSIRDGQGRDRAQQSTIQFGDGPPIPIKRWDFTLDPAASGQCRGVAGVRMLNPWGVPGVQGTHAMQMVGVVNAQTVGDAVAHGGSWAHNMARGPETWDVPPPEGKFYVALEELRRYAAARGVKA